MKIVAFVDTLGFKQKITSISHEEAKEVIKKFNSEIYNLWKRLHYHSDDSIHGQTFSDSFILYTDNDNSESLRKILIFLKELYQASILRCDLPLRGGIALGDFDRIPATEFNNLQKELVIGTAFIDAYYLESAKKIKGSKIIYRSQIHERIETDLQEFKSIETTSSSNDEQLFELSWGDVEYLKMKEFEVLYKFVELGTKAKWLDHYYHTLDTFLTNEPQRIKHQIFEKLLIIIKTKYKYNELDDFIENFITAAGIVNLKKSFLAYIRSFIDQGMTNEQY